MAKSSSRSLLLFVALAALLLLGCETTNLIGQSLGGRPTTRSSGAPLANPTRDPEAPYDFVPLDQPRCSAGDNSASIVNGTVTIDGFPAAGQVVFASASPGGENIIDPPTQVDENGNFQIIFVCGNLACNGSFWIWLVNEDSEQLSPFIQYIFDDQCRRGTVNFGNP